MSLDMSIRTVKAFIHAINSQDLEAMGQIMKEDHEFADAGGGRGKGREEILKGWPEYYSMFPDYKIEISDVFGRDSLVAVFGYASATCRNLTDRENSNYWRIPAAWKALVSKDKIVYWQVFCDYTPIQKIIEKNPPA